ncbi:2-hydroxychromene-2-carboxylate isomerase [Pseudodonghicola flavimaris]|uniref:2-hydroxychromene-2-carboxylate isomerase n=1 Tax=Pseudodonghicola flavimaris TaxID=3050036 RepID=A0ABT7F0Y6_9RHOB|nr:2-hydroxychromene-2-carboxylate isomerase [Pseudodonghicola flavimaris]MDK3018265.1 2-hydroxychromene-2-carboxylate isomerase [Pseudodonghicola flavimaris]
MQEIEFLYDFVSNNSYLVHQVLPGIAAQHGVKLRYTPVFLGAVFKATGNAPPFVTFRDVPAKLAYQTKEIERFIARHDIRYHMSPHFPLNTLPVLRGAIYARGQPWEADYIDAIFNAMWIHGQQIDRPEVIEDILTEAGLPKARILAAMEDPEIKAKLTETTDQAVARGVFGAPSMLLGEELFFGKDSLPDLVYALTGQA